MTFESKNLVFDKMGISMDGGTISIHCVHKLKEKLIIRLLQHQSPKYYEEISKIPGRIYINDTLVEIRSNIENEVMTFLERITSSSQVDEGVELLNQKIKFIKSKNYITFKPKKMILSDNRKANLNRNED